MNGLNVLFVGWILLGLAVFVGWIFNIIHLVSMVGSETVVFTVEFVLRIVGIFVMPLGAIMGFFF